MFKRGVITDEISQNFETAVKLALKYRLDGVEIRSVWDKGPHELDNNDIKRIRKIMDGSGLEVCCISSPFFKCHLDNPLEVSDNIEILKKSINLAHKVGAGLVRGFTFWKKGGFDENLDKIVSRFDEALKILEKEKIVLVLESDPGVFASNAGKLRRVMEKIDSPYVKALWDPGNDLYDPDGEIPFPDGYDIIKPYMVHMHFKDAVKKEDKTAGVPVGEGQVDYGAHFEELKKSGYGGYVVLETHYRPRHDISEELLALPKGSAFSYLGYEATEECLIKWESIL